MTFQFFPCQNETTLTPLLCHILNLSSNKFQIWRHFLDVSADFSCLFSSAFLISYAACDLHFYRIWLLQRADIPICNIITFIWIWRQFPWYTSAVCFWHHCLHNEPQISSRGISIFHAWLEFSQNFNNKKSLSTSFKIGANFLDMCQLITAVCLFHHFDNNVNVNNNHYHHLIQNSRKRLKIHHAWLAFSRNLIKKS